MKSTACPHNQQVCLICDDLLGKSGCILAYIHTCKRMVGMYNPYCSEGSYLTRNYNVSWKGNKSLNPVWFVTQIMIGYVSAAKLLLLLFFYRCVEWDQRCCWWNSPLDGTHMRYRLDKKSGFYLITSEMWCHTWHQEMFPNPCAPKIECSPA